MVIKLYQNPVSAPSRACMMVCELLNVPVEFVEVNLLKRENTTPEYVKKNPLHTVPVLEEDDFILHDSHAIITYLADTSKYAREDALYPKDVKRRAFVNQKLFFNSTILFPRLSDVTKSVVVEGSKTVTEEQISAIEEAYEFLEESLYRTKYIAGNNITLADITAFTTVTTMDVVKKVNSKRFPKVTAWIEDIGQQPYAQRNAPGVLIYKSIMDNLLA